MPPPASKKYDSASFADVSGGCNSIEHPLNFIGNQASEDSIGYIFAKSGITKYPGCRGLYEERSTTENVRHVFTHKDFSGNDRLYRLMSGGSIVQASKYTQDIGAEAGLPATKFTGMGNGEGWSCDAYGKKYIANGVSTAVLENNAGRPVGLRAPSSVGLTLTASAGGALPDGQYTAVLSYVKVVDGEIAYYGKGVEYGAPITIGGGNNTIDINMAGDVGYDYPDGMAIWLKNVTEGEVFHYFYAYETDWRNPWGIASDVGKNPFLQYEITAMDNGQPPAIEQIAFFANRLWGFRDNIIYYSEQGEFNQYDVEIWRAANYRTTGYKITGMFSVGQNMYFNTEQGILMLPNGDINDMAYLIETRWHFEFPRTVAPWNGGVVGVTNDGVRLFDGMQFTSFDFGYPVRSALAAMYNSGYGDAYRPAGYVYRRGTRDEYHLLYCDESVSTNSNNTHAVLNLSSVAWENSDNYKLAWEFQPVSGHHVAVDSRNQVFVAQNSPIGAAEYSSNLYTESTETCLDSYVIARDGSFVASEAAHQCKLKTREFQATIMSLLWLQTLRTLSVNEAVYQVQIFSGRDSDKSTAQYAIPASVQDQAKWDEAVFDSSRWADLELSRITKTKLPIDFKVRSFYVEIAQTDNDPNFKLMQLNVVYIEESGRSI